MVDLSTVAGNKISNPPWVKFQSAGWVNFPSAPTCLWLKRLEAERFKTKPDAGDEAIELTVDELNWLLDGIDLWRNRPHQILTPRFVT
ncbi:hypothetical protein DZC76_13920 [Pseudomonas sp. phDV1]|nr:hypothetical protein DZC76_13920 [Pseudomonas sp. phDV1]